MVEDAERAEFPCAPSVSELDHVGGDLCETRGHFVSPGPVVLADSALLLAAK